MWSKMWSILCALENKVCSSAFGWKVLKISIRPIWSNASFKVVFPYWFSDLLICPLVYMRWSINSSTIIVFLSISPYVNVSLVYWSAPMLDAWIFTIIMSSSWIDLSMQCLSLFLIIFFILNSIFFWNKDYYSGFLLVSIWMEYLFPFFYFQSLCISSLK